MYSAGKGGKNDVTMPALWGRKNRSIWGGSFCSIEEVVRKGKKDTRSPGPWEMA